MKVKPDQRFNDVKHAIVEVSQALKNCPLKDDALAALVYDSTNKKIGKSTVLEVLKHLRNLEVKYLKEVPQ